LTARRSRALIDSIAFVDTEAVYEPGGFRHSSPSAT
jgi:hypothetical protein